MRILTGLAVSLLATPAILAQAPAPTLGQRVAAARPEITRLMDANEFAEALAKGEALLPAEKPAFDKSTVQALHVSTRTYVDLCQLYFLVYQAADNNGQWEKGLDYLNKGLEVAKENVASGKDGLAEQRDYYSKRAATFKSLLDRNAEAIGILKAKTKLEDYEEGTMAQVKGWEKELAEADKWNKFFQYDSDLAARDVDNFQRWVGIQDKKIKDMQGEIDSYKPHPGDKAKWVEAVIVNKAYLEAYKDKADKISLLFRMKVLDPENHKVQKVLDAILGKASAEPEKAAPKKKR